MPSLNLTPTMSFGKPLSRRNVFDAAVISLNTISLAVVGDNLSSVLFCAARSRTRFRWDWSCANDPNARQGSRRRRAARFWWLAWNAERRLGEMMDAGEGY